MSISSIGSTSATQTASLSKTSLQSLQAALDALNTSTQSSSSSSSDTVTISVAALKALLQSQSQDQGAGGGHEPPPMTDDMAAKMGADIKEQNADLFTQLDTDEDGVLSAAEAEAGKDTIDAAIKAGTIKPPPKPEEGGGAGGGAAGQAAAQAQAAQDLTTQLIAALHKQGMSNDEIAQKLGTSAQQVQDALQSAS